MTIDASFHPGSPEVFQPGQQGSSAFSAASKGALEAWDPAAFAKVFGNATEATRDRSDSLFVSYQRDFADGNISAEQALGKEIWDHLSDQNWLIDHRDQVSQAIRDGLKKVYVLDREDFLKDIAKHSNGNIYYQEGNTTSDWLPWNKVGGVTRMRLYLHRSYLPDNVIFDQLRR